MKRTRLARKTPLKRGTSQLKRSQLKRKPPPPRNNTFPPDSDPQLRCRSCNKRGAHQHHAVRAQDVETWGGDTRDKRNALRVCFDCHDGHHHRADGKLKTSVLRDENIEFAFELMGAYAADYLDAKYDNSEADERIELALADTMAA